MNPAGELTRYIFKSVSFEDCESYLHAQKATRLPWLLRESSVDGMLTISYTLFSKQQPMINGNTRYALTDEGWINASDLTRVKKKHFKPITAENAGQHLDELFKLITSSSLVYDNGTREFRFKFKIRNLLTPTKLTQNSSKS